MADSSNKLGTDPALPLRRAFVLTISAAHRRAAGNPTALKALTGIERRAAATRQRALDLHRAFEDRWTAKEAIRLWQRHLTRSGKLDAPEGAVRAVDEKQVLKIAAANVRARTSRRLSKIEGIKTRMANAVVRNLGSPSLKASFGEAAPGEAAPAELPRETMRQRQRRRR